MLSVCCRHCLEGGGSRIFTAALVSVDGADRWLQELVLYVHTDVISKLCRKKKPLRYCITFGSEMTLRLVTL